MIQNTKQGELFFLLKVKSHFKTPKTVLMEDCNYRAHENGIARVLYFPTLEQLFKFDKEVYVCQDVKANLLTLLNYDKFVRTPLYEHFVMGESLTGRPHRYVMALVLKKCIWMITRSQYGYRGGGGISINQGKDGFTIVPIGNYLMDLYGNLPDEVEYPPPHSPPE